MKIEMSHEIKSTKEPATQLVNHTNQLVDARLTQPKVELTLHTNLPNDK